MVRRINRLIFIWIFVLIGMTSGLSSAATKSSARIISLKPNITEIIFALGAGDLLVGATTYCKRPAAAQKITRVADYISAQPEKILSLKPTLIVGSKENSSQKEIQFLQNRGFQVELLSFATLTDLRNSILQLGTLLNKNAQAKSLVAELDDGLTKLKQPTATKHRPKTLIVVGYDPLVVVGGNNFIEETFSLLGFDNVARVSRLKYPTYATEQVIHAAPEIILDLSMAVPATSPQFQKNFQEHLKWWQRFPSIPAVSKQQIFPIDIEEIRAVPSLPKALEKLSTQLR